MQEPAQKNNAEPPKEIFAAPRIFNLSKKSPATTRGNGGPDGPAVPA